MKILHIVPGLNEQWNGIARMAKDIAAKQSADIVDMREWVNGCKDERVEGYDEVWVHSNWLPMVWKSCLKVMRAALSEKLCFEGAERSESRRDAPAAAGSAPTTVQPGLVGRVVPPTAENKTEQPSSTSTSSSTSTIQPFNHSTFQPRLVRMPHANLDPLRYHSKYWKKLLVSPIERWLYRHTDRVIVTCEAEKKWCEDWGVKCPIEIHDCKQYFNFSRVDRENRENDGRAGAPRTPLNVLFLGRANDPLKGIRYLEQAVKEINNSALRLQPTPTPIINLHLVSNKFGNELEKEWYWCDVLCLPTLSENFGRVIAEALAHGKQVITTDGAPAWKDYFSQHPERGIYLMGYREGDAAKRIELLKEALKNA